MKYSIIIQDLEADEARDLIDLLEGEGVQTAAAKTAGAIASPSTADGVDVNGLTWDGRIHAGSKGKNKDGSWKRRKGVDDATVAAVEAELKALYIAPLSGASIPMPQPTAAQATVAAAVAEGLIAAPVAPVAAPQAAPVAQPVAAPVAAPVAPAAPAAPAAPQRDFQGLMNQISRLMSNNSVAPNYPLTICSRINQGFGITTIGTITDIMGNPQMVDYAWQCLEVDGKAA